MLITTPTTRYHYGFYDTIRFLFFMMISTKLNVSEKWFLAKFSLILETNFCQNFYTLENFTNMGPIIAKAMQFPKDMSKIMKSPTIYLKILIVAKYSLISLIFWFQIKVFFKSSALVKTSCLYIITIKLCVLYTTVTYLRPCQNLWWRYLGK